MAQIIFAVSPTGKAEAAAQVKFAFTTSVAATILTTIGSLRVTSGTHNAFTFAENDNLRFYYNRSFPNITLGGATTSGGTSANICTLDFSALSDSEVVAVHWRYTAATNPTHDYFASIVRVSDGTVLASGSVRYGDVTLPGTASTIKLWDNAVAASIKGAAVFNGTPASGVHINPLGDPSLVALYLMDDDGTGKIKDWVTSGTSLTVTNGTLDATVDTWDPVSGEPSATTAYDSGAIRAGTTNLSLLVPLPSSITSASAGLAVSYSRTASAPVTSTMSANTVNGTHLDWSIVPVSASNAPELHRIDLPDAAFAVNAPAVTLSVAATGMSTQHFTYALVQPPTIRGTAAAGTLTTSKFSSNVTYGLNQLARRLLEFTSGACIGQRVAIVANAVDGTLDVAPPMTTSPSNGDTFDIL